MIFILNFKFTTVEYTNYQVVNGKVYEIECVGIGLKSSSSKVMFPLPITNFIKKNYRNKSSGSINSQKNASYEICKFLNYCYAKINSNDIVYEDLKHKGIFGLKLIHGSSYISDLSIRSRSGELSPKYVQSIIRYLNKFYIWLSEEQLIDENLNNVSDSFSLKTKVSRFTSPSVDIFNRGDLETIYPPKSIGNKKVKLTDFGKNRLQLVKEFLEVIQTVSEDIYLGVCLQFFGGLRKGEVVNLTVDSLENRIEGYYLNIDDNRNLLFPNKRNTDGEQVKKPRHQSLFWNTTLEHAFYQQYEKLNALKNNDVLKNNYALLVSSATGKPLSSYAYWSRFIKAKQAFMDKLLDEGRFIEYEKLNVDWSTHITRGVFTHFCFDVGMSYSETAIARGDSDLNSIIDYIDSRTVQESMSEALNQIKIFFNESTEQRDGKFRNKITPKHNAIWEDYYND